MMKRMEITRCQLVIRGLFIPVILSKEFGFSNASNTMNRTYPRTVDVHGREEIRNLSSES